MLNARLSAIPKVRGIHRSMRSEKRDLKICAPAEVRALRDSAIAGATDPLWASMVGYLFLTGKIGPPQFAAGRQWTVLASDYRDAIQSPAATSKSPRLERGSHGHAVDIDSEAGQLEKRGHESAVRDFNAASEVVLAGGNLDRPEAFLRTFRDIVENDLAPAGLDERNKVDEALTRLAYHWGLIREGGRKRR